MIRQWCVLLLALSLTVCGGGFTGQSPLFSASEGDAVFPSDGMLLIPTGGGAYARERVTRDGADYDVGEASTGPSRDGTVSFSRPVVRFISIADTPEDDYVAQIQISGGGSQGAGQALYYAFLLRTTPTTFAVWLYPDAIKTEEDASGPEDNLCRPNGRDHGECEFSNREDVLAYYKTYVHDRLARDVSEDNLLRFIPSDSEPGR